MKATIRGRSNGESEGRDRRREARTASRARAPRGYDNPGLGRLVGRWLRDWRHPDHGQVGLVTADDGNVEGHWADDIDQALYAEVDCADAMRLVMHADGRMVDPKSEESKWL